MNTASTETDLTRPSSPRSQGPGPHLTDPWRTRQEYIDDRDSAARAEQRAVEAHQKMMEAFQLNRRMMWFAAGTLSVAFLTLLLQTCQLRHELSTRQSSTAIEPPPTQPQLSPTSSATPPTDSKDMKGLDAQASSAANSLPTGNDAKSPPPEPTLTPPASPPPPPK